MSNKIVNLVDKARVGDPVAKAVLRKIADQSNDFGGGVWSSHDHIAYCLEWSRVTVSNKCQWLKDQGWLEWEQRTGTSNLYQVNLEKLEGVKDVDTPVKDVDTPCKGDLHKSFNSPPLVITESVEEPVYIDDTDGVPDELAMEWDTFLRGWKYYFPGKTQPNQSNSKMKNKFKTRMKSTTWRTNWKEAIKVASTWSWTHAEGWFKADWILHNDENIFKLLDGTFDFKLKDGHNLTNSNAGGKITKRTDPNRYLPPFPKEE